MDGTLEFPTRQAFRDWLEKNSQVSDGVWLLFGKKGGPTTLSASDALEEALCFGWIDGQMRSIDEIRYQKYFSKRIPKSVWSEKNKGITKALIEKGIMTQYGLDAIEQAKQNGMWDAPKRPVISGEQIEEFKALVAPHEPAYTNLLAMSPSVQRTYTGYYLDAKSEQTRKNRLEKIIDRLNQNLKPM